MKMKKYLSIVVLALTALFLGGCDYALFAPEGYIGVGIRNYMFATVFAMLIVVIPTIAMTIYFAIKYRKGKGAEYEPEWEHSNKIEFFAWGIPITIIAVLATLTYIATHKYDPRVPIKAEKEALTVQVVGMDWKWLFIYPEQEIATINEVYAPVDQPVEFLLTSNSAMYSFYVPRLGGQLYAMAGMENVLNLVANKEGSYRGIASNYGGFGHSGMQFKFHSVTDEKFAEWVAKVKSSPKVLDANEFTRLEERTRRHPVEYFGSVQPLLFKDIIAKFSPVNAGVVPNPKLKEAKEEK